MRSRIPVTATRNHQTTTSLRAVGNAGAINNANGNGNGIESIEKLGRVDVLVAGSLAVDLSCDYDRSPAVDKTNAAPDLYTSNPAIIGQSVGGVGYNVAIAAKYVGSSVLFCSLVGDDLAGRTALATVQKEDLSPEGIQVLPPLSLGARTAQYVAMNDARKDLFVAMADMSIMELPEKDLNFEGFWKPMLHRTKPRWIVVDANWSPKVMKKWTKLAQEYDCKVAFEPVSTAKSGGLFGSRGGGGGGNSDSAAIGPADSIPNNKISLAAPNALELATMHTAASEKGLFESPGWWDIINRMGMSSSGSRDRLVSITSTTLVDEGVPQQSIQLLPFIPCIITKLGGQGVLLTQLLRGGDPRLSSSEHAPYILSRSTTYERTDQDQVIGGVYMRIFPPSEVIDPEGIVSVNGAGDTLLGAVVAGLARGKSSGMDELIGIAQEASLRTLKSAGGVSSDIVGLRERFLKMGT